jgi:hypothetical protein
MGTPFFIGVAFSDRRKIGRFLFVKIVGYSQAALSGATVLGAPIPL